MGRADRKCKALCGRWLASNLGALSRIIAKERIISGLETSVRADPLGPSYYNVGKICKDFVPKQGLFGIIKQCFDRDSSRPSRQGKALLTLSDTLSLCPACEAKMISYSSFA